MRNIKVKYDGRRPCVCGGNLKIWVNNQLIYDEDYQCSSTGRCYIDFNSPDQEEHVESGKLVWDEAKKFDKEIQDAVKNELSKVQVCCGGCI